MSSCDSIQNLLPFAVRGEIDESRRAEMADHIQSCPDCARYETFLRKLQQALDKDPLSAPPPVYFEGVLAQIHRAMPSGLPRRARSRRWRVQPQAFASGLMTAMLFMWIATVVSVHRPVPRSTAARRPAKPRVAAAVLAKADRRVQLASRTLVAVPKWGLMKQDSEILKLPREMRLDLGLPEPDAELLKIRI